jgi:hypothetical protein
MQSADTIKAILERRLCPNHDIYPHVEIIGNEIQIICCCSAFREICNAEAKYMLLSMDLDDFIVEVS